MGATTVAIDFVGYQALMALGAEISPAKATSFVLATVCAYLLNRWFTFRASGGSAVLGRFVVLYAAALVVNVGINAATLAILGLVTDVGRTDHVPVVIAFLTAQAASSTLNFLGMRHWVFTTRTSSG